MNHVYEPVLNVLSVKLAIGQPWRGLHHHQEEFIQGSYPSRCQETLHLPAWWRQCAVLQRQRSSTMRNLRTIVYSSSSCWHKSQSSKVLHKKRDSRLQIQVHLNPSSERRHQGQSSVICSFVLYIKIFSIYSWNKVTTCTLCLVWFVYSSTNVLKFYFVIMKIFWEFSMTR